MLTAVPTDSGRAAPRPERIDDEFQVAAEDLDLAVDAEDRQPAKEGRQLVYARFLRDLSLSPDLYEFGDADTDQGAIRGDISAGLVSTR